MLLTVIAALFLPQ